MDIKGRHLWLHNGQNSLKVSHYSKWQILKKVSLLLHSFCRLSAKVKFFQRKEKRNTIGTIVYLENLQSLFRLFSINIFLKRFSFSIFDIVIVFSSKSHPTLMLPLPFYHYKEEYDQRLPAHFDQTVSNYETTGSSLDVAILLCEREHL